MLTAFLQTQATGIADTTAAVVAQTPSAELSLFDLTVKGGWLMIPLALLLVVAIVIFVERWLAIRKAAKVDLNFMNSIKEYIHEGKMRAAISLCQSQDTPVAHMIEKGIERIGRPLTDVQTAVENVGNLEVAKLEEGLPFLSTISGGGPMIGFLGTVMGMIQAFFNMSSAGNNIDISLLSGGIYTAMVTTVAGLVVGLVAYFGYNYLVSRVERVVFKMEASTIEFMDLLNEPVNQ